MEAPRLRHATHNWRVHARPRGPIRSLSWAQRVRAEHARRARVDPQRWPALAVGHVEELPPVAAARAARPRCPGRRDGVNTAMVLRTSSCTRNSTACPSAAVGRTSDHEGVAAVETGIAQWRVQPRAPRVQEAGLGDALAQPVVVHQPLVDGLGLRVVGDLPQLRQALEDRRRNCGAARRRSTSRPSGHCHGATWLRRGWPAASNTVSAAPSATSASGRRHWSPPAAPPATDAASSSPDERGPPAAHGLRT